MPDELRRRIARLARIRECTKETEAESAYTTACQQLQDTVEVSPKATAAKKDMHQ